jgi:hypothetical protein
MFIFLHDGFCADRVKTRVETKIFASYLRENIADIVFAFRENILMEMYKINENFRKNFCENFPKNTTLISTRGLYFSKCKIEFTFPILLPPVKISLAYRYDFCPDPIRIPLKKTGPGSAV